MNEESANGLMQPTDTLNSGRLPGQAHALNATILTLLIKQSFGWPSRKTITSHKYEFVAHSAWQEKAFLSLWRAVSSGVAISNTKSGGPQTHLSQ